MSGTSLDGVDIACCRFSGEHPGWDYSILEAITVSYDVGWKEKLGRAHFLSGEKLMMLDREYGSYLGNLAKQFHLEHNLTADFLVSHGHTVHHRPSAGLTFQLGHGASIAAECGLPTINDFRSTDVALGGQGAPLVPVGDEYLFSDFDFCLNLGGFSNISFLSGSGIRLAFDICPVNIALNYLARKVDREFDQEGLIARSGKVDQGLLDDLNLLGHYAINPPKSLGREWFEEQMAPLLDYNAIRIEDRMRTLVEHISIQLRNAIVSNLVRGERGKSLLVTGGGAHNQFLVERIRELVPVNVHIPGTDLIDYKESLIFAFLGLLRWNEIPNVFSSVTGASRDSCSGSLYMP